MSSPFTPYLLAFTVLAALGSGLVAGLFFGFSTAVMKALARLPPAQGMKAMQDINVVILNPVFLAVFMGTALISAVPMNTARKTGLRITTLMSCIAFMPCAGGRRARAFITAVENPKKRPATRPEPRAASTVKASR